MAKSNKSKMEKATMDYHYDEARIQVGDPKPIRVKPEMIEGDSVEEIEMRLFDAKVIRGRLEKTYFWRKLDGVQSLPKVFDMWVEIGDERKSLKFKGTTHSSAMDSENNMR